MHGHVVLTYAGNERSNIIRVGGQFAFASNVGKRFVEAFHQIGILLSYESVRKALQANVDAVKELIVERARMKRFLSSYGNNEILRTRK